MGSKARVVLYAADETSAANAAERSFAEIEKLNGILSDYRHDSESMQLVEEIANQWHPASPELVEILSLAREVWAASDGAFDPTVGPLTALWRPAFEAGVLPDSAELTRVLEAVGMEHLEVDTAQGRVRFDRPGMRLDFGAIGKGYAAQRALDVLREHGCPSALVDLGGDLALGDAPPGKEGWRVLIDTGLDTPHEVTLANVGVATSGDLYRHVEIGGVRYSHILDPRTGLGLTRRVAVTVIDPEPWRADALASAASVLGSEGSQKLREAYPRATILIREAE